jgi:DNA-binding transcriptional MerR regulator
MTISELSRAYNVTFRTLRFYEQIGLLEPSRAGTVRLYSSKDVIRLQLILKGKQLGFTLNEVAALIKASDNREHPTQASIVEALTVEKIEAQIIQLEEKREQLAEAIRELEVALTRTG